MGRFLRLSNGVPRSFDEASTLPIYDETIEIGVDTAQGGVTTGSPVTLPSSQIYEGEELEVYVNGQRADSLIDYNFVGIAPRTQVSFTFDLVDGDLIRFRRDRAL